MSPSSPEGYSNKMMDKDLDCTPSTPCGACLGASGCLCPERKGSSFYSPFELGTTPHPGLGQRGWRTGSQLKP